MIDPNGSILDKERGMCYTLTVEKYNSEMEMMKNVCFGAAEILLPDFERINGTTWSVVACDQYTSEPAYWKDAKAQVGETPSTLNLMLPEIYLQESESRIPEIRRAMDEALEAHLIAHPDAMIYLERVQSDGAVRRGIIGAVDLECYDYTAGSTSLIRATEGTVLERIPPRVAVRRGAPLELPHVMLLIDDRRRTVIEEAAPLAKQSKPIYDFDLMLGGGHVTGYLLDAQAQAQILGALGALASGEGMTERYGDATLSPLLFAVGDGNHSLATAKASYEEIKAQIGEEAARSHPARYALAEIVNLHDEALQFEPIYRVVFGADRADLLAKLKENVSALKGSAEKQSITVVMGDAEEILEIPTPEQQLTVGTLQRFLDAYLGEHPEASVDYIHGEDSLRNLAREDGAIGFLFDGMEKNDLFRTVLYDGALPRKTFSMGHAQDKRYYLECRKIR